MQGKPRIGAQGQSHKHRQGKHGHNQGAAIGQPKGTRNRPCQPAIGAVGQRLATNKTGARRRATNARR